MTKLFSTDSVFDGQNELLFFGVGKRNIQSYIDPKYPFLLEQAEEMRSVGNWSKNEINLIKEKTDFESLDEAGRHIYESGLKFAIAMDSLAGRGPLALFNDPKVSNNPEWELYITNHQNNELLHSESYTEIIRAIYSDPKEFINSIIKDENVINRAAFILDTFTVYENALDNSKVPKKELYLALINFNIIEGIRFFCTFATNFSFSEQSPKLLSGSSNIFKLIARDEMIHLQTFQWVINKLRVDQELGFVDIVDDSKQDVLNLFKRTHKEESLFIKYLFKYGSPLLGMNEEILQTYMNYIFKQRMEAINLDCQDINIPYIEKNPLPWMRNYLDSSQVKTLPQELESTSYVSAVDFSDDEISMEDL